VPLLVKQLVSNQNAFNLPNRLAVYKRLKGLSEIISVRPFAM